MRANTSLSLALLLGTALIVGGCNRADKSAGAGNVSAVVEALSVDGVSDVVVESHFAVPARNVPAAEAMTALETLGLAEETDAIGWASMEGADGGTFTYDDVVITDGETRIEIDAMTLTGVHDTPDGPTFDKMTATDLTGTFEGGTTKLGALSVVDPSPKAAAALAGQLSGLLEDDMNFEDGDLDFRALAAEDLDIASETLDATLTRFAFARPRKPEDEDGFVRLADFDAVIKPEPVSVAGDAPDLPDPSSNAPNPMPITLSLESVDVAGLRSFSLNMLNPSKAMENPVSGLTSAPYDSLKVGTFSAKRDTLSLDSDGASATYTTRGDITEGRTEWQPITIVAGEGATDPTAQIAREQFEALGYERMVMRMGGTSRIDAARDVAEISDGYFDLEDGLRIETDYTIGGLGAMQAATAKAQAEGSDVNPSDVAGSLTVGDSTIRITDNSFVDRMFNLVAAQQGTSPKMLRTQAKGVLAMGALFAQTDAQANLMSAVSGAVGEFISTPGSTLQITVDPEGLVPMDRLSQMDDAAITALNVSATTTKP